MSDNNIKIKRPVLNKDNFDKTNESFKSLVESYKNWCEEWGEKGDVWSFNYEQEMIDLLLHNKNRLDGYKLAKVLESDFGVDPDSNLVDILDMAFGVVRRLDDDLLKKWVKENNLSLGDVVGKKIKMVRNSRRDFDGYFVTTTYPEKFQVCIDQNPDRKGGYVVNLEDIVFSEEKTE